MTGRELREKREKIGLSQQDLASHLGVSYTTISRWEREESQPHRAYEKMVREFFEKLEIEISATQIDPSPAAESLKSLVGYWPFDENSGYKVRDLSGDGNDGLIHGAKWTKGRFNSALEFKKSYLEVANAFRLQLADQITIAARVKFNSLTLGQYENILRKEGSYVLEITPENNLQFNIWVNKNWQTGQAISETTLQTDIWYYLVGTHHSEAGSKVYIDGNLAGTGNKKGRMDITENALFIGAGKPNWLYVDAIIDEIRIWNVALTKNEIKQTMNRS